MESKLSLGEVVYFENVLSRSGIPHLELSQLLMHQYLVHSQSQRFWEGVDRNPLHDKGNVLEFNDKDL